MQQTPERSQAVRLYFAPPVGARVAELVGAADSKSVLSTLKRNLLFLQKI